MLITEHSKTTTASAEKIWSLWEDISNWNKWDDGIDFSELNGEFKAGTEGFLKPKGGPKLKFKLLEVVENKRFKDVTKLPFTKLIFTHDIKEENGKRIVTHKVEMAGPLSWLFNKILGQGFKNDVPGSVESLIKTAESK